MSDYKENPDMRNHFSIINASYKINEENHHSIDNRHSISNDNNGDFEESPTKNRIVIK